MHVMHVCCLYTHINVYMCVRARQISFVSVWVWICGCLGVCVRVCVDLRQQSVDLPQIACRRECMSHVNKYTEIYTCAHLCGCSCFMYIHIQIICVNDERIPSVCICICVCVCVYVYVCACDMYIYIYIIYVLDERISSVCICIYKHMCIHLCMCVCYDTNGWYMSSTSAVPLCVYASTNICF